jgi:hypothetical protein
MPIIQTGGENSDLGQGMPSRLRLYMHGGSSKWSKQNHGHRYPRQHDKPHEFLLWNADLVFSGSSGVQWLTSLSDFRQVPSIEGLHVVANSPPYNPTLSTA